MFNSGHDKAFLPLHLTGEQPFAPTPDTRHPTPDTLTPLHPYTPLQIMTFDPRTIATPIFEALDELRSRTAKDENRLKEQKNQAIELYTYLSTWGMMRLKAEEKALSQEGKKQVVKKFFECLESLSGVKNLSSDGGLVVLKNLDTDEYLGLTGLGLALAQEFSFWANAVYSDIKGE